MLFLLKILLYRWYLFSIYLVRAKKPFLLCQSRLYPHIYMYIYIYIYIYTIYIYIYKSINQSINLDYSLSLRYSARCVRRAWNIWKLDKSIRHNFSVTLSFTLTRSSDRFWWRVCHTFSLYIYTVVSWLVSLSQSGVDVH